MIAPFRQGSHSLVNAAKLVLPLAALMLLSTVFLMSRSIDPSRAVATSDRDISEMTRAPRIRGARFAGVTSDQAAILVQADSATMGEDAALNLSLSNIVGQVDIEGRTQIRFSARAGRFDQTANWLTLEDTVEFSTSDGYEVTLPSLRVALGTTDIRGEGGIQARAPAGQLRASQMRVTRTGESADGYLLAFSGDVRLIYQP